MHGSKTEALSSGTILKYKPNKLINRKSGFSCWEHAFVIMLESKDGRLLVWAWARISLSPDSRGRNVYLWTLLSCPLCVTCHMIATYLQEFTCRNGILVFGFPFFPFLLSSRATPACSQELEDSINRTPHKKVSNDYFISSFRITHFGYLS